MMYGRQVTSTVGVLLVKLNFPTLVTVTQNKKYVYAVPFPEWGASYLICLEKREGEARKTIKVLLTPCPWDHTLKATRVDSFPWVSTGIEGNDLNRLPSNTCHNTIPTSVCYGNTPARCVLALQRICYLTEVFAHIAVLSYIFPLPFPPSHLWLGLQNNRRLCRVFTAKALPLEAFSLWSTYPSECLTHWQGMCLFFFYWPQPYDPLLPSHTLHYGYQGFGHHGPNPLWQRTLTSCQQHLHIKLSSTRSGHLMIDLGGVA